MRNLILLSLLIFGAMSLNAQFKCGDQIVKHQLEEKYPGINELIDATFKNALQKAPLKKGEIYRIPVVFHVVHNTEEQNLSDELIKEQIDILNEDFRRLNADAVRTRDEFLDVAADAEIEFFLAGEDPDGNPSSGITRTFTDLPSFIELDIFALLEAITDCGIDLADPDSIDDNIDCLLESLEEIDLDAMKSNLTGGIDPWDTERYMNIWSCNLSVELAPGEMAPFLLGFAYPPVEAPNWPEGTVPPNAEDVDGVVVHYQTVGRNNPSIGALAGISDLGRTCVHEVGHYLGLRHIWGDGDCTMDDGIDDTPVAESNSQPQYDIPPCSDLHAKDTCLDDDLPDMIENYMDYSLETCQNAFTIGQVNLMRSMLEGPRAGLLENGVSSAQNLLSSKFRLLPNPASDFFSIETDLELESLTIYNHLGQKLRTITSTFEAISTENMQSGSYLLQINANEGTAVKKLIIQN